MNSIISDPQKWLEIRVIMLPGILIGLTFHEWAHGKIADYLGDPTPSAQGRLTLNPLPHIDWVGFAMLLFFSFGWAKPMQVNPYQFKNTTVKKGMMMVSLAGPGMNLLIAVLGAIVLGLLISYQESNWILNLLTITLYLIQINLILFVFNLIPVPPLDGSKILSGLLPDSGTRLMYSLEPYGMAILLLLILTNITDLILLPAVDLLMRVLLGFVT